MNEFIQMYVEKTYNWSNPSVEDFRRYVEAVKASFGEALTAKKVEIKNFEADLD